MRREGIRRADSGGGGGVDEMDVGVGVFAWPLGTGTPCFFCFLLFSLFHLFSLWAVPC